MTETNGPVCSIADTESQITAVVKVFAPLDKLPEAQRSARANLIAALPLLDAGAIGFTCTLWRPPKDGLLYMEPGIIVARTFERAGEVIPSALPAGRAAHFRLEGPYDKLPAAWETLFGWCKAQSLSLAGLNWEVYGGDPANPETSLFALLA